MPKKTKKERNRAVGTIRVHHRGFGFLIPDNREFFPEDIFIPKREILGSIDGDTVEVEINLYSVSEKGPEGRVCKILHRGRSHLAGIVALYTKKGGAVAYAPMLGENKMIHVLPSDERELQVGDRIIIHVIDWGGRKQEPRGELSAYIGHISDPSCDIAAAVEEYELDEDFSTRVIREAKRFGSRVLESDLEGREDLRRLECITIDPATAKDFDDALTLRKDNDGHYHLGVHIADVSHYVRPGTALDDEARVRCNSTYFPGKVIPMLPHELSSHLCSLMPGVDRLAISVLMQFDKHGELLEYEICRSVIHSKHRFSYEEAREVLEGRMKSPYAKNLKLMVELCHHLKRHRCERGSIEFALPDTSLQIDENGVPKEIHIVEYDITHQLVEEFMLKANEVVATYLSEEGLPLTYRVHDEPNPENIREFAAKAAALGFKSSDEPTVEELQEIFDEARSSPFGDFLAVAFIRSMKLATYSTQNVGHYGLGLEHYTHFTSPIRRYIDLVVHRLLFEEPVPNEEELEAIALQCSEKERLSSRAENSVLQLKKLRLLQMLQEKDPEHVFEGVVTATKPFGVIFDLTEFLYEGLLPLGYHRRRFVTGDKIQVQLEQIDLVKRETQWKLAPRKKKRE